MIFKNFESTDIVAGRINKVSSGFWVDGNYAVTQSSFTTSSTQVVLTVQTNMMFKMGCIITIYITKTNHIFQ